MAAVHLHSSDVSAAVGVQAQSVQQELHATLAGPTAAPAFPSVPQPGHHGQGRAVCAPVLGWALQSS